MSSERQLALAEQIAGIAQGLHIETALIGASALAFYGYVRATSDLDFATLTHPHLNLPRLAEAIEAAGLHARVLQPEDDDPLGGTIRVWESVDDDGDPVDPIDIVNFLNPHSPQKIQKVARLAIEKAQPVHEGARLRCVPLAYLIALKLYARGRQDLADIVEVLAENPAADLEEIRSVCQEHGLDEEGSDSIDKLIDEAKLRWSQPKR